MNSHQHHGLEAPFDRGPVHDIGQPCDLDQMTVTYQLTRLQRDVAYHLYMRKASYRACAVILGVPYQNVRGAALAVATKMGFASPNAIDADDGFGTLFAHAGVPSELHATLHQVLDVLLAGGQLGQLQESPGSVPLLVLAPAGLHDELRARIGQTVTRWQASQATAVRTEG